jgi:two-component system nitrogen regulation response regulator GlnG
MLCLNGTRYNMKQTPTLLVVDDEPNIAYTLKECLSSPTLQVFTVHSASDAIRFVAERRPDVVLMDVRLPDMSGLDAYDVIRERDPRLPVIVMTAFARTETAIEATQRGAFDYLIKPVDLHRLQETIARAVHVSRLAHKPAVFEADDENDAEADLIVGLSPPMQEVYKAIGRVAAQDATVLILGESGTGKELVARAIYHYSRRNLKPFLAINCAALPESLLESELFGHERGAFTGADQRRIGKFEQVNGGTIFLDEIGDMSPATQAKALRLLQQQQFERVGGNTTIETDVRVITATNRDIAAMVASGEFRRDLYYRLNGFTIVLPPLRERKEDVPLLANHFLKKLRREEGCNVFSILPSAIDCLMQYDWPGNVRELESAIRFAAAHATTEIITLECLPDACRSPKPQLPGFMPPEAEETSSPSPDPNEALVALTQQLLEQGETNIYRQIGGIVDSTVLLAVLNHVGGNQQQAAEILGISRMTLRSKLRSLRLHADDPTAPDE